jgi:hypothetical protein
LNPIARPVPTTTTPCRSHLSLPIHPCAALPPPPQSVQPRSLIHWH